MGWISDTWAEITSGGAAETETYNGGDSGGDMYQGPNMDGSAGYTVDWGDNGSDVSDRS